MVLLVQNQQGYLQPVRTAGARLDAQRACKAQARLQAGMAAASSAKGLIALSGAQAGPVGQALLQGDAQRARRDARWSWRRIFPHRFYIELQRAGRPDDEAHVRRRRAAGRAAEAAGGGDASGAVPARGRLRGARGARLHRRGRDPGQPAARAQASRASSTSRPQAADGGAVRRRAVGALANTLEIAKRCNLMLELGKPQLPTSRRPNGMPIDEYFRVAVARGPGRAPGCTCTPMRRSASRSGRATWSGWSSRSTPSSRWASRATS